MRVILQYVRNPIRKIHQARKLRRRVNSANKLRINLSPLRSSQQGWIPAYQTLDLLRPEQWVEYFEPGSLDAILAEDVWQKLTPQQACLAVATCFQFLKPGGYVRVAVPDGYHPSSDYIQRVRPGSVVDHLVLYDHESLEQLFQDAGFQVRPIEYFDAAGSFHTTSWNVSDGLVQQSLLFDKRNESQPFAYTSLFIDAVKELQAGVATKAA